MEKVKGERLKVKGGRLVFLEEVGDDAVSVVTFSDCFQWNGKDHVVAASSVNDISRGLVGIGKCEYLFCFRTWSRSKSIGILNNVAFIVKGV